MAKITTREQFAELCLQKLGKPMIPIHVSPEQLDICIESALQFYHDYHDDASIRTFIRRQVGANLITISTNNATNFIIGEKVSSSISNINFHIYSIPSENKIGAEEYFQPLQNGEILTGEQSGATAIVSNSIVQDDVKNRYIDIPDYVIAVSRLLNFAGNSTNISMFDIRYQIRLNDLYSMTDGTMTYYTQVKQQLELMDQLLIGQKGIRFNRIMNKCFIDMDWDYGIANGDWLLLEGYASVDPNQYPDIYNDRVFQELTTNYIKKQWGQNLSLYGEIALPGGIKLNADKILADAERDVAIYEQQFQEKYEKPMIFLMG